MSHEIVILGGGVGGVLTANLLAHELPDGAARIRLVDATGLHVYQPGFLYVSVGKMEGGKLARDVRSLLSDKVELLVDSAQKIDPVNHTIELEHHAPIPYDHLVLATGAQLALDRVPGLAEATHTFYSLTGAERLREAMRTFTGGNLVIGVAGMPYKCPPAPVEFAFLAEDFLRKAGVREQTHIDFLSPLNRAFTIESASKLVQPLFEERGIELHTFVNIESVDPVARTMSSLEGETFPFDLAVLVPPHKGADVVREAGFTAGGEWVVVDRHSLLVEGHEDVWALGDCTNLPISKAGSTAHFEAPAIAEQIAAAVTGRSVDVSRSAYGGKVMCFLETGRNQATVMRFDYENPPEPPRPSMFWHLGKAAFNKAYWMTVPTGRLERLPKLPI